MPEEALDMALDDLVQGGRGRGKGTKKGGGKSTNYWKGSGRGKGKGKRSSEDKEGKEKSAAPAAGASLDMSLEEMIESDKGHGKGKRGKDSDKGKGKRNSDSYKGKGKDSWSGGRSYDKGGWKGDTGGWKGDGRKGKSSDNGYGRKGGKGGDRGNYSRDDRDLVPSWNEHDDRDDEEDEYGKGSKGKGGGFRGRRDDFEDRRGSGAPRAWSDNDRSDRGTWQRVEQEAPIRETRRVPRDREERGGREVGRSSKAVEPRGVKRRAVEEPEGARSTKSIKVTNIPRDVNVQDIRDAFEAETGKIVRCRLDRGVAWIAFQTSGAARKAVETFDRGELNGQNIGVALDH